MTPSPGGRPARTPTRAELEARARSLEAREREVAERLEQLERLKTEFVAMVAHDLRSPLGVVVGFADLLQSKWARLEEAEKVEFVGAIVRSTDKLLRMIEDLVQVARIDAGELTYTIQSFDMRALIEETVAELEASVPGGIVVRLPPELPPALGDERHHRQILHILLSTVLGPSAETPVEVHAEDAGGELRVAVRNRGGGSDLGDAEELFQKFPRPTQPGGGPGHGVGLYMCKRMIEAQGGRIWAESGPGEGSGLSYTVPVG
jgi:signal transduction histidine kinase